jgi:hypothetical protein
MVAPAAPGPPAAGEGAAEPPGRVGMGAAAAVICQAAQETTASTPAAQGAAPPAPPSLAVREATAATLSQAAQETAAPAPAAQGAAVPLSPVSSAPAAQDAAAPGPPTAAMGGAALALPVVSAPPSLAAWEATAPAGLAKDAAAAPLCTVALGAAAHALGAQDAGDAAAYPATAAQDAAEPGPPSPAAAESAAPALQGAPAAPETDAYGLANGLEVRSLRLAGTGTVTARLTLYVPDAPEGAAHLASRALPLLGCGGTDRAAFEALKDRQGVLSRAESGLGWVSWTFESLPANAEVMIQLLADEALRPAWSKSADLPEVLARVWERGASGEAGEAAALAFRAAAGDPAADPPPAAPVGADEFVEMWSASFRRPARAILAVVGDIESVPLRRAIAQHFGPWEGVGLGAILAADPPPGRRSADSPPGRLGAGTPPGRRPADPPPGRLGTGTPLGQPLGKETPEVPEASEAPAPPETPETPEAPKTPATPEAPKTQKAPARRAVVRGPSAPQAWVAWDLGALGGPGGAEALAGLIPWLLKTAQTAPDETIREIEIDPGGRWIRAAGFGGAPHGANLQSIIPERSLIRRDAAVSEGRIHFARSARNTLSGTKPQGCAAALGPSAAWGVGEDEQVGAAGANAVSSPAENQPAVILTAGWNDPLEARLMAMLAEPLTQARLDAALAARDEHDAADALHPRRMLDRAGDPDAPRPRPWTPTLEELRAALEKCMGADSLRVLIVAPPAPAR